MVDGNLTILLVSRVENKVFLHLFKFNEDWGDFVDSIYRVDSNLIG